MFSDVRTASAAGVIDVHEGGRAFFVAPAAPTLGGTAYPGAFPALVRVDGGAPQAVVSPATRYARRAFSRLRLEGLQPGSDWLVVVLEQDEAYARAGPTLCTFNVLAGVRRLVDPGGDSIAQAPDFQCPKVAPVGPAEGYAVLASWRSLQFLVDWDGGAPRPLALYWCEGVTRGGSPRWVLSEEVPAAAGPFHDGRTSFFRSILYPGGRIALADLTAVGDERALVELYATAEVG